jgi:hypothetical protein
MGAGLPTAVNTHDAAGQAVPDAKVACIDNDPVVQAHAKALLAQDPNVRRVHPGHPARQTP